MEMSLNNLRLTLEDFAQDPTKWWGQPTDGDGEPVNVQECRQTANSTPQDTPVCWYWGKGVWLMQGFGTINPQYGDEMNFLWYNSTSGGNTRHQGLEVDWHEDRSLMGMRLTNAAANTQKCYTIQFNCDTGEAEYSVYNGDSMGAPGQARHRLPTLESIVLDLVVAMLPPQMICAHHPRHPVRGTFAM